MPDAIPEVCMRHRGNCPPGSHQRQARVELDQRRGSARERGYDNRWDKARKTYLARHPLCVACERHGRVTAGNVVDHIKPHRGQDQSLFWNAKENWQTLCDRRGEGCHEAKTARESGIALCREHGVATAEVAGERVCRDCGRAA
jgi:5-methylcytosine-specific restriction protein A